MDDYIFLIIAVAISIFGAINKNKKAKEAGIVTGGAVEKPRNYFMDQLLGKDFLEEPIAEEKPPVKLKQTPTNFSIKANPAIPAPKYYHETFKSTLPSKTKHQSLTTTTRPVEVKNIDEIEEEDTTISYLEDFSLRKAVVYSIIMERKY